MDWIVVSQDRERCRADVSAVMSLGSIICGEFLD
jgi:hypothetical protein